MNPPPKHLPNFNILAFKNGWLKGDKNPITTQVPVRPMPRTEKLKPKCMPHRGPKKNKGDVADPAFFHPFPIGSMGLVYLPT